jgi:hypothetical protein
MMTLKNAIKTLDDVIPPHTHRTVDREHMPIVLAWEAVKVELESRVPVARCKNCEYAERYERADGVTGYCCGHPQNIFTYGERWNRVFKPVKEANDFCSYGEKRTGFVDDNKIGERKADEDEPLGT